MRWWETVLLHNSRRQKRSHSVKQITQLVISSDSGVWFSSLRSAFQTKKIVKPWMGSGLVSTSLVMVGDFQDGYKILHEDHDYITFFERLLHGKINIQNGISTFYSFFFYLSSPRLKIKFDIVIFNTHVYFVYFMTYF